MLKHQDVAVDPFQNSGTPAPESLQGLLDAYIAELKVKRQKLREKRKPSKVNSTQNGEIDDDELGAEDECEEDDMDDDYDYIEDKLLS